MNRGGLSVTVASMDAGVEPTWMYLRRVTERPPRFMSTR